MQVIRRRRMSECSLAQLTQNLSIEHSTDTLSKRTTHLSTCNKPKLRQSKLRQPKLRQPKLRQSKLRQPKLRRPKLRQSKLRRPELRQSKLRQPKLRQSKLLQPKLRRLRLRQLKVRQPRRDIYVCMHVCINLDAHGGTQSHRVTHNRNSVHSLFQSSGILFLGQSAERAGNVHGSKILDSLMGCSWRKSTYGI